MTTSKLAYSIPEYAVSMSIGRSRAYDEIRAGRLKVSKIGKRSVITAEQADAHRALLNAEAEQRAA